MFDYRELDKKEFVGSAAEDVAFKVVGVGNIRVQLKMDEKL